MESRVGSTNGTVPHLALIYEDVRERNRMIDSCLKVAKIRRCSPLVISVQPEADHRFISRRPWGAIAHNRAPGQSILDVRDILANSRDPVKDMLLHVRRARRNKPGRLPHLVIGDWHHLAYDRYEVLLAGERAEHEMSNHLCCFRAEGFWSLEPKQIAALFELHDQVSFGPTTLEMRGSLPGVHLSDA